MLTKNPRKSSIRIETKFQKTTIFMHQQKMQMRTRREISISSYRQLLTLCQKRNILLITGIWMLKLCRREWNEHGPHGIGALNKNSEVFADVCCCEQSWHQRSFLLTQALPQNNLGVTKRGNRKSIGPNCYYSKVEIISIRCKSKRMSIYILKSLYTGWKDNIRSFYTVKDKLKQRDRKSIQED